MGLWKEVFGDNPPDMSTIPSVPEGYNGIGQTFTEAGFDGSDIPPVIHNDHLYAIADHLGLLCYKPGEQFNIHPDSQVIITTPNTVSVELGINGSTHGRAGDIADILSGDGASCVIVILDGLVMPTKKLEEIITGDNNIA